MARAPINGDTLKWARLASRLERDALAKAAGTTSDRIAAFEEGTTAPTFRQLTLMANNWTGRWDTSSLLLRPRRTCQ